VSERTVQRKAKSVRIRGVVGLKHGNYKQSPVNKIDILLKNEIIELVKSQYYDFNLYHALEKINENRKLQISYSTFYRWCLSNGLGKGKKKRRTSKARVCRERISNEGLMLQMDGSHHMWNGKDKWCLIACIDDATSHIPFAKFFKSETTVACMEVLKSIIEIKGIPEVIYTDNAGWSGKGKRNNFSQFKRACEELGIRIITTSSPQSKGRIERAWKTFQDRIIPEMRLNKIKTIVHANQYLEQCFLPEYWNKRNTVIARSSSSRYKVLPLHVNLSKIFCLKYERQVTSDHCFMWGGARYKLLDRKYGSLSRKTIEIHIYQDKCLEAYWGHIKLSISKQSLNKRMWLKRYA